MHPEFQYPITFLPCHDLLEVEKFYNGILHLPIALKQHSCVIFQVGRENIAAYWGFCTHYNEMLYPPENVFLTLVVNSRKQVDEWHEELISKNISCIKRPQYNSTYRIYQALYRDPIKYTIEIQAFDPGAEPQRVHL